jgi:hypothetical protein
MCLPTSLLAQRAVSLWFSRANKKPISNFMSPVMFWNIFSVVDRQLYALEF